ncbi:MAG: S8 family serine peptidase, partial [Bacteroidota bacterium]
MKKYLGIICLVFCFNFLSAQKLDHAQGEMIILFHEDADLQEWANEMQMLGLQPTDLYLEEQLSIPLNIWLVSFDFTRIHERRFLELIRQHEAVDLAQFNHFIDYRQAPDDPDYFRQWPFNNTGQTGGTIGLDLGMEEVWDITTGGLTPDGDTIVVCIIDDGLDQTHQDFEGNLWVNYDEIPNNGIDDDNNGFVDDVRGWNAFFDNDDIYSDAVHGTTVTGVLGAKGNNGVGIAGIMWDVKM